MVTIAVMPYPFLKFFGLFAKILENRGLFSMMKHAREGTIMMLPLVFYWLRFDDGSAWSSRWFHQKAPGIILLWL